MAYKIHFIEDSSMVRYLAEFELGGEDNIEMQSFENGESYLSEDRSADLLIIDYYLDSEVPGSMDGFEVARTLRAKGITTPIVYFSGKEGLEIPEDLATENPRVISKDNDDFLEEMHDMIREMFG